MTISCWVVLEGCLEGTCRGVFFSAAALQGFPAGQEGAEGLVEGQFEGLVAEYIIWRVDVTYCEVSRLNLQRWRVAGGSRGG